MGEKLDGHVDTFAAGGREVNVVAAVVFAGGPEVPSVDAFWGPGTAPRTRLKTQHTTTRRGEGGGVEVEGAVKVRLGRELRVEVGAAKKVEGE